MPSPHENLSSCETQQSPTMMIKFISQEKHRFRRFGKEDTLKKLKDAQDAILIQRRLSLLQDVDDTRTNGSRNGQTRY